MLPKVCYGMLYGIGAKALGEQLGVDENDAAAFIETFKARYTGENALSFLIWFKFDLYRSSLHIAESFVIWVCFDWLLFPVVGLHGSSAMSGVVLTCYRSMSLNGIRYATYALLSVHTHVYTCILAWIMHRYACPCALHMHLHMLSFSVCYPSLSLWVHSFIYPFSGTNWSANV